MQPELHIGSLTIQTFGICFGVGFVAAGAVAGRRLREIGKPVDWAYELIFAALVGGLVGSRVDYLLENWSKVHRHLLSNLFSGSGLVWYGGVIGGVVAVCLWAWWRGFLGIALLDLASIPLSLGYAIGRIGCQVSGDGDYGKPSHLPWAMAYPHGTVPTTTRVQPTPVYETLAMGAVALLLWRMRDRVRPGALFASYLVLSGTERLLVEFIRRNKHVALGLTIPQLISIVAIVVGTAWLATMRQARPLATAGSG